MTEEDGSDLSVLSISSLRSHRSGSGLGDGGGVAAALIAGLVFAGR